MTARYRAWTLDRRTFGVPIELPSGRSAGVLTKFGLAGEIVAAYALTRWRMRRGDLRSVVAAHRGSAANTCAVRESLSAPEARRLARRLGVVVDRTLRLLPTDDRCLSQSLVLLRILAARGMPATLVIGAHSGPEFAAHAWIEFDGVAVLPSGGFDDWRLLDL